jgi:hypothetical protein
MMSAISFGRKEPRMSVDPCNERYFLWTKTAVDEHGPLW